MNNSTIAKAIEKTIQEYNKKYNKNATIYDVFNYNYKANTIQIFEGIKCGQFSCKTLKLEIEGDTKNE